MRDLASEPSMEEILASIRRIIAEDGQLPANEGAHLKPVDSDTVEEETAMDPAPDFVPTPPPPPADAVDVDDDEVLELTELEPEPLEAPEAMPLVDSIALDDTVEPGPEPAETPDSGLVDDQVAAASAERLAALSPFAGAAPAADNPFEALVRDMMRPMLKDWLDTNLPAIVEKLVSQEITRITGKRG